MLLYGETSTEDLETRLEHDPVLEGGHVVRAADARPAPIACFTPLLGRPIILNLAGAFTLATALGVDPRVVVAALRTLKPVSNRLEVVEERGVTWIRDAYNSNQFGFRAALEVAAALPAARRFLATPGVIELGRGAVRRQPGTVARGRGRLRPDARRLRHQPRGVRRRPSGCRPRATGWSPCRTGRRRSLADASTLQDGDAVILENDLPDLYERSAGVFWRREPMLSWSGDRMRTVAVLFGGRSLEHDVSVVSGLQILHALDPDALRADAGLHRSASRWWIGDDLWHTRVVQGRRAGSIAADGGDAVARLRHVDADAGRATSADRPATGGAGRSRSTSSCRCCTARSARTAASRGCSSWAAARTSAAACWRRRSA